MFDVQKRTPSNEDWVGRTSYDSRDFAIWIAGTDARLNSRIHRIVEQPTGRVVAAFGSSGKRLTFPIATAIAYAALSRALKADAQVEIRKAFREGFEAGRPSWE